MGCDGTEDQDVAARRQPDFRISSHALRRRNPFFGGCSKGAAEAPFDDYAIARRRRDVNSRSALAATTAPPSSTAARALTAAATAPARSPPSGIRFQHSE